MLFPYCLSSRLAHHPVVCILAPPGSHGGPQSYGNMNNHNAPPPAPRYPDSREGGYSPPAANFSSGNGRVPPSNYSNNDNRNGPMMNNNNSNMNSRPQNAYPPRSPPRGQAASMLRRDDRGYSTNNNSDNRQFDHGPPPSSYNNNNMNRQQPPPMGSQAGQRPSASDRDNRGEGHNTNGPFSSSSSLQKKEPMGGRFRQI